MIYQRRTHIGELLPGIRKCMLMAVAETPMIFRYMHARARTLQYFIGDIFSRERALSRFPDEIRYYVRGRGRGRQTLQGSGAVGRAGCVTLVDASIRAAPEQTRRLGAIFEAPRGGIWLLAALEVGENARRASRGFS